MGLCKAAVVVKLKILIFFIYAIYYISYEPTLFMIWIFFYIDLLANVYHPNLQLN